VNVSTVRAALRKKYPMAAAIGEYGWLEVANFAVQTEPGAQEAAYEAFLVGLVLGASAATLEPTWTAEALRELRQYEARRRGVALYGPSIGQARNVRALIDRARGIANE
jgi:hypothetical protein